MYRAITLGVRRKINVFTKARSLSTPSNPTPKKINPPSGSSNERTKKSNKFLNNILVGFFIVDMVLFLTASNMEENNDLDKLLKNYAPDQVYNGLKLFRSWLKDAGLVQDVLIQKPASQPISLLPASPPVEAPAPLAPEPEPLPNLTEEEIADISDLQTNCEVCTPAEVATEHDQILVNSSGDEIQQPVVEELVQQVSTPVSAPAPAASSAPAKSPIDTLIPSLPSEVAAKSLQSETTETIVNEIAVQSIALRREFEQTLLKDVNDLDLNTLRVKYIQLASEFFERNKWEGVRMHQALKQLESEVSRKYLDLMRQQRQDLESHLQSIVSIKNAELSEAIAAYDVEAKLKLQNEVATLKQSFDESLQVALAKGIEEEVEKVRTALQNEFTHQLALEREGMMKQQMTTQESVEELRSKLAAIFKTVNDVTIKKTLSLNLHKASSAILTAEQALMTSHPVGEYLNAVKDASQDELVLAVVDSIPNEIIKYGAPSLVDLKVRFGVVRNEARKAALAPEGVPTILGQVVGNALASISWSPKGYVQGAGVEEALARAEFLLDQGKLKDALKEVDSVKGYAGELLADWKRLAHNRLISDQAVKVLRASSALEHSNFS